MCRRCTFSRCAHQPQEGVGFSFLPQVWFEVSAHTNRVHFHAAADGSAPLGLSLPLELLQLAAQAEPPPALTELLDAIDRRCALLCRCRPGDGGSAPGSDVQCA